MEEKSQLQSDRNSELRVGVFICRCGTNIGGVVDIPKVVEYTKKLRSVIFVDEGRWICSVDYLEKIKNSITEHRLNRVVVACCTPRTHELTFKTALREAGLNPYLLEFVSIREQCSWAHKSVPQAATEKAKELIEMGVAKARYLEPAEEIRIPVGKECMVIGGGIAGLEAARAVAELGFNVLVVEEHRELGGLLTRVSTIAPDDKVATELLNTRIDEVMKNSNIRVYTSTTVEEIGGYIGHFDVRLKKNDITETQKVSTVIVATGMTELEPFGLCGYPAPNVLTQLQLEEKLRIGSIGKLGTVVFINCVGSRNEYYGCCNIGCLTTVKNAKRLLELNPEAKVYILYRDLNLCGTEVQYLRTATEKYDIRLVRYPAECYPVVINNGDRLTVHVHDILLDKELSLITDLVVLSTALRGSENIERLKKGLKVSADAVNFFQEAHIKLRPLDFATEGIYLCGCARSPKSVKASIEEALGAAMRAAIPMRRGYVEAEGIVADIDTEKCVSCGLCAKYCPFSAIEFGDRPKVLKPLCKGCGICAAECPKDAIKMLHFTDEQLHAQIEIALSKNPDEKIIAFCCHWCALGAADTAGVGRMEYPSNVRIIRVMCSGRVDARFIEHAFELGAAGVLIAGCEFPTCHYINGNERCRERVEKVKKKLAKTGISPERLQTIWLSAADGKKFASGIKDMCQRLRLKS